MALQPRRVMKLPLGTELARAVGDHLAACIANPDRTVLFDLRQWPLAGRTLSGFFASQLDARDDGTAVAVARHHHQNPYRLYALDPWSAEVSALPADAGWGELECAHVVGRRVLVAPDRRGHPVGSGALAWWEHGAVTPVDLPAPEAPAVVEHDGRRLAMPDRIEHTDVFALPDGDALVIWRQRLFRVSTAGATPLPPDHLFTLGSSLRHGRHDGVDDRGRVLTAFNHRFLAMDRDGDIALASPGSTRVTGSFPGPRGMWFLACEEAVHVVLPDEGAVIELDLREMRLSPRYPLFMPKPVYVPARDALLVLHAHDAWEFDLDAVLREKRVPFAKHAQRATAARRSHWIRKVKAAKGPPRPLDQLSMWVRGGGVTVEHPRHGIGVVTHASETRRGDTMTVTATVVFEDRQRTFACQGDRWVEHPWYFG